MQFNRGVLYLAFGKEFDKLTAASAKYSRQFTNLPICVLTNLKEQDRNIIWKEIPNVFFKYSEQASKNNRAIKVSLLSHTPFDETLFMDSDALIQNPGIEKLFDCLEDYDMACQFYGILQNRDDSTIMEKSFILKTYDKLLRLLREEYPIELFAEAALLFRKTDGAKSIFDKWQIYWKLMGSGRDMPAFCFAVKHSKGRVNIFGSNGIKFCKNAEDENAFIQHKGFAGFEKKFGLPAYKDWSPRL